MQEKIWKDMTHYNNCCVFVSQAEGDSYRNCMDTFANVFLLVYEVNMFIVRKEDNLHIKIPLT